MGHVGSNQKLNSNDCILPGLQHRYMKLHYASTQLANTAKALNVLRSKYVEQNKLNP